MDMSLALTPIVSLLAGILIFVPTLVGQDSIYLIAVGVIGLAGGWATSTSDSH
ncbi:MAG: DUF3096 domain-containing protein [Halioglobus sp.]|nr:DUF3096 domain-containing protein [Halioglobus sp.]